uniref:PDZ domain-containing protein n=1 Tax=Mucochytrium quahogii TaxID=96639 RepID=A0A7S2RTN5_9STRA|mmetsp:Transcript_18183/g.30966  ORF Transcript_18183/g.30966 Transcript_18183/m.30966 type:complete len:948 (-) Transcript_18183:2095-4938(-)
MMSDKGTEVGEVAPNDEESSMMSSNCDDAHGACEPNPRCEGLSRGLSRALSGDKQGSGDAQGDGKLESLLEAFGGAEFSKTLTARCEELGSIVLDDVEDSEKRAQLEKEKEKMSGFIESLTSVAQGFGEEQKREELKDEADALLAEAQGLLGELGERPEGKQLQGMISGFLKQLSESAETDKAYETLRERVFVEHKQVIKGALDHVPSILEKVNEHISLVDGENLSKKALCDKVEESTGGIVRVKEQKFNGDENIVDLVKDNANTVIMPLLQEKANALKGKLQELRKDGQGQELLAKGMEFISQHQANIEVNTLDTDTVISWGERMVKDEKARGEMVGNVKDMVLEFLISYLPNVEIPPIEGDKEGVGYKVENLDMKGFKLAKENVDVVVNEFTEISRGAPFITVSVTNMMATLSNVKWAFQQNYFPHLSGSGHANAMIQGGSIEIGLQLVKAALKKDEHPELEEDVWQPQLLISGCDVDIKSIELAVTETHLSWLYNTMTDLFARSLRLYIISLLQDTLMEHMSNLGDTLNTFVTQSWPMVASYLDINLSQLPEASVAEEFVYNQRLKKLANKRKDVYSVTFNKKQPLGIVFMQAKEFVAVKEFKRGPDNKMLPAERGGEIRVGDIIVGHNGQQITSLPLPRVMERLRRARWPMHLTFLSPSATTNSNTRANHSSIAVQFDEAKLYMIISSRFEGKNDHTESNGFTVLVKSFKKRPNGTKGPAEACGKVTPGMVLTAVNNESILGKSFNDVCRKIKGIQQRPLTISFGHDPEYSVAFEKGSPPSDLRLDVFPGGQTIVTGFTLVKGPAEIQCGDKLEKGDIVDTINGTKVERGNFPAIINTLKTTPRPMCIGFVSPDNSPRCESRFETGPLGLIFYRSQGNEVAFKSFSAFPGPAKATGKIHAGHVLLEINGNPLPTIEAEVNELLKGASSLRFRDMEIHNALITS